MSPITPSSFVSADEKEEPDMLNKELERYKVERKAKMLKGPVK